MAYSNDFRKKVVEAYENGEGILQEIADRFSIHKNTVNRWVQLYRETQSVTKRPHGGGRQAILSQNGGYDKLLELHQKENNLTDEEYSALFDKVYGIQISRRAVNRAFSLLGVTKKKITFHAREQLKEEVQEKIFEYLEEIEGIDVSRFVFVDEAAANYSLVREYGRALKGERAYGRKPHYRGKRVSMIGALGFDGMRCGMFWDGYVDGEAFDIFVDEHLIPSLKPGDVVVWDNFSVHKKLKYEKKINDAGAFLLFLPPYSPEFSPIEQAWSKIKNIMRKFAPTCSDTLWEAFCVGYDAVTEENAQGWFEGCGCYHHFN